MLISAISGPVSNLGPRLHGLQTNEKMAVSAVYMVKAFLPTIGGRKGEISAESMGISYARTASEASISSDFTQTSIWIRLRTQSQYLGIVKKWGFWFAIEDMYGSTFQ